MLPLTYANEALRVVMVKEADLAGITRESIALLVFMMSMIILSTGMIRRQLA